MRKTEGFFEKSQRIGSVIASLQKHKFPRKKM